MKNWHLPKHVFISQAHMIRYGGSEMVTLELAEYLSSVGSKVTIGTWAAGNPMMTHLNNDENIHYYDIDDERLQEVLVSEPPQMAWIHHQIIPRQLLLNPSDCVFIFNHMSGIHPLEFSWSPLEAALASVHLYNSRETLERQRSQGACDTFDPIRMKVFANPSPDQFLSIPSKTVGKTKKIGIVSNHIPVELNEAILNPPIGISFVRVGHSEIEDSRAVRLNPNIIESFDGVITIGKTVQYSLLGGVPVYCYDHFGGPGWLGSENFDLAETNNFSGRGFVRKSPDTIRAEVLEGFSRAKEFAESVRSSDLSRFTLSCAINEVLDTIGMIGTPTKSVSKIQVGAHLSQQTVVGHYLRNWLRATAELGKQSPQKVKVDKTLPLRPESVSRAAAGSASDSSVATETIPKFLGFQYPGFKNPNQLNLVKIVPSEFEETYRAYEHVSGAGYIVPRHVKTDLIEDALSAGESLGERFVLRQPYRRTTMNDYVLEVLGGGRYLDLISLRVVTGADLQPVGSEPEYWLTEECIDSGIEGMSIPIDYKVYACRGKVTHVKQIDYNVFPPRVALYDGAFIPLELTKDFTLSEQRWQPGFHIIPRYAGALLEMAATLSLGLEGKFVKVSCYDSSGGAVFSGFNFESGDDDTGVGYSEEILRKLDMSVNGAEVGALSGFDIDMLKFRASLDQRATITGHNAQYSRLSGAAVRGDKRYPVAVSPLVRPGASRIIFLLAANVLGCLNGDESRAFSVHKLISDGNRLISGSARVDEFVTKSLAYHDPKSRNNAWHTARAAEVRLSTGDQQALEVLRSLAEDGYDYAAQRVASLENAGLIS